MLLERFISTLNFSVRVRLIGEARRAQVCYATAMRRRYCLLARALFLFDDDWSERTTNLMMIRANTEIRLFMLFRCLFRLFCFSSIRANASASEKGNGKLSRGSIRTGYRVLYEQITSCSAQGVKSARKFALMPCGREFRCEVQEGVNDEQWKRTNKLWKARLLRILYLENWRLCANTGFSSVGVQGISWCLLTRGISSVLLLYPFRGISRGREFSYVFTSSPMSYEYTNDNKM